MSVVQHRFRELSNGAGTLDCLLNLQDGGVVQLDQIGETFIQDIRRLLWPGSGIELVEFLSGHWESTFDISCQ